MGYTTDFDGTIEVVPPLTAEDAAALEAFSETRHQEVRIGGDFPGIWCNWVPVRQHHWVSSAAGHRTPVEAYAGIRWNEAEKFYSSAEWMKHIIDNILAPKGYMLNGEIEAQGEDPEDRWRLVVKNNKVFRQEAEVKFLPLEEVK